MVEKRILVITSCTGEKRFNTSNLLVQDDFRNEEILKQRESELSEFSCQAALMYTGMQHLRLMEGVSLLRSSFTKDLIDVYIISAGYGLIEENKSIVPYEVTFNSMNNQEIKEWSKLLKINDSVSSLINTNKYDFVIFLLGDKYIRALDLPLDLKHITTKLIFLASNTSKKLIPINESYKFLEVGQKDASEFSYGLVGLKGYLFKLLAQELASLELQIIDQIKDQPGLILEMLYKYRKISNHTQQTIFSDIESEAKIKDKKEKNKPFSFFVPSESYAKNYGMHHVNYFIPETDDRVDPNFNFLTDEHTPHRDVYRDDVYAHEIYEQPNYDGVLISMVNIEKPKTKYEKVSRVGVHDFIRYHNGPIMGDCGAFLYINEDEPPFETQQILNYYQETGFDFGVSVDHLIIGDYAKDPTERQRRYDITKNNAADFIGKWTQGNYNFNPIGVAQGWDPKSYRESVGDLISMGYEYVALGGLARSQTKEILEIMTAIAPIVPDYLKLHLFGIARLEPLQTFHKLGMTSFDSASHLRRAWLGSSSNYFTLEGKSYAAIRIPQGDGGRVKRMIAEGKGTKEEFAKMESEALNALRLFDKGQLSIDKTLETVLVYDEHIGDDRDSHSRLYREVLEDKPWKKCECKICREIGIDVIIFRGNNRNRRRGFHNTYVFYKQKEELFLSGR